MKNVFESKKLAQQVSKIEKTNRKPRYYIGVSKDEKYCSYSLIMIKNQDEDVLLKSETVSIGREHPFDRDVSDLIRIFDAVKIEETE